MKKHHTLSAAFAAALLAPLATADTIHHTDLSAGASAAQFLSPVADVSISGLGGTFAPKTVAGHTAVGLSGGAVNGEIDGDQEFVFTFSQPVYITSLSISFLYTAGNHGDLWDEVAQFSTNLGTFDLTATGATSGTWTGMGELLNDSPAIEGHGGKWTIAGDDIFGGPITSLTLLSGNVGEAPKYGDFAFDSITYRAVPAPGAMALLLIAAGVSASRRRK